MTMVDMMVFIAALWTIAMLLFCIAFNWIEGILNDILAELRKEKR